jgi:hypothetical protein
MQAFSNRVAVGGLRQDEQFRLSDHAPRPNVCSIYEKKNGV